MAQLYGVDVSEFQGQINWDALNAVSNFVIIRSCFGTARQDFQFLHNRSEARRVRANAGPLGVGYYHYAYPNNNGPEPEADFFVSNVWPLQPGEQLVLDWEEAFNGNHVAWVLAFCQRVEAKTGVKPLVYLNQSLLNGHDWTPVINNSNGLWVAQYDGQQKAPAVHGQWPFAAMKQWTDAATVAGIGGHVDADTFYGDFNAFYAYGYKSPATPAPTPAPAPAPQPVPQPTPPPPTPVPTTPPVTPTPSPPPPVTPTTPVPPGPGSGSVPGGTPGSSGSGSVPGGSSTPLWDTTVGRLIIGAAVTVLTPVIMDLQNFHPNDAGLAAFIVGAAAVLTSLKDFLGSYFKNTPKS
jgi:GH25 family lysozyme M1 (1,4-beta-N-acetylmuramidase)